MFEMKEDYVYVVLVKAQIRDKRVWDSDMRSLTGEQNIETIKVSTFWVFFQMIYLLFIIPIKVNYSSGICVLEQLASVDSD